MRLEFSTVNDQKGLWIDIGRLLFDLFSKGGPDQGIGPPKNSQAKLPFLFSRYG